MPSSRRRPAPSTATVNGDDKACAEEERGEVNRELSDPGSTNSNAAGVAPAFSSANVRRRVSPTTTAPKSTSVVVARAFARLGWHSTGISTTPAVVESDRVVCNVCAIFGANVTVTRDDIPAERFPGWSYSTPNDPRCSTGNSITRNVDVPYDTFVMVTRFRYRFPTAKSRKTTRDGLDANAAPASVTPHTGSRVYRRSGSAIRDAATSNRRAFSMAKTASRRLRRSIASGSEGASFDVASSFASSSSKTLAPCAGAYALQLAS